jgi:hypothetical protein
MSILKTSLIGLLIAILFFVSLIFSMKELEEGKNIINEEIVTYEYLGYVDKHNGKILILRPLYKDSSTDELLIIGADNIILEKSDNEENIKVVKLYEYTYNYNNTIFEKLFQSILLENENGNYTTLTPIKIEQ